MTRPPVRVNQIGYLPGRPMRATLVHDVPEPVAFAVRDAAGDVVYEGRSQPWPHRREPTSGLPVHVLDFTGLRLEGSGFRVEAAGHRSHPFAIATGLYEPLARDALRFFTLMRADGHPDTAVPVWTGPGSEALYPGWRSPGTFDVSGGWYDAGDYGKYVTSGAIAVWQLLATLDLGPGEPLRTALVDECRVQLDWLLRMQVPPGDPLAGLAFHRVHGTTWPPVPCPPEADRTGRVLHRPSTGAALHLAAATAHAARLLRHDDPAYAARLLAAARTAHDAAVRLPVLLAPDDHARFGGGPYHDDDLTDDRFWADTELWLATGEDRYRPDPAALSPRAADAFPSDGFDFDRVDGPARLDLAAAGDATALAQLRAGADRLLAVQAAQPWGQPYAPDTGWAWGSNGRLLNNLVVLAVAHRLTGEAAYADAVASGADYLFGRNALGQSYVTGHGTDCSHRQRARQFARALDPAAPPPPPGALAGGANSVPAPDFPYDERLLGRPPQCCYLDEPTSEVTNDVCIRWNAPLVWVAVRLSTA